MSQNWTWSDYDVIRKEYAKDKSNVYSKLKDRSPEAIDDRAVRINVKHDSSLREEETKLLEEYGDVLGSAIVFLMPDRTVYEVKEALQCLKS